MFTGFRLALILLSLSLHRPTSADNPNHPLARLRTPKYRAKIKIVRGLWVAAGLLMLLFPLTHFIVTLGLFTTFLSFTILDEAC
tara:strand:- start:495 stop:746 length:252 start_codon:yes stop_codon:yes gene_type:complete